MNMIFLNRAQILTISFRKYSEEHIVKEIPHLAA